MQISVSVGFFVGSMFFACVGGGMGESTGLNTPGGDTELDPEWQNAIGALAVEKDEAHVWLVRAGYGSSASLYAVDPDSGTFEVVLDVSSGRNRRMLFPSPVRALLLEEIGEKTRMTLIDSDLLYPVASRQTAYTFTNARTSPSGKFAVVTDLSSSVMPVRVVDTSTLEDGLVSQYGQMPQGVWNRTSDRLWTVSMIDGPSARVRRFHVTDVDALSAPEIDLTLTGFGCDPKFDWSWVAVSPDDRLAVFPLWQGQLRSLTVIDQYDGSHTTIPGNGPVGFTHDGSTIVSHGVDYNQLYLTDASTLETAVVTVPTNGELTYHTAANGTFIVLTTAIGSDGVLIYDWQTGAMTEVAGPDVRLEEFVARPQTSELWLASLNRLLRLDMGSAVLEDVGVGFPVGHVNILPAHDQLVLSEPFGGTLRLYSMAERAVSLEVELPEN